MLDNMFILIHMYIVDYYQQLQHIIIKSNKWLEHQLNLHTHTHTQCIHNITFNNNLQVIEYSQFEIYEYTDEVTFYLHYSIT